MLRMRAAWRAIIVTLAVTCAGSAHAQPTWVATDLGTLGGTTSNAGRINDHGLAVGTSHSVVGLPGLHPFVWSPATGMVDIGTLGSVYGEARDVNNLGQVVGNSKTTTGLNRAFMWTAAGGMINLGGLCATSESAATGINDAGQVVGSSGDASCNFTHAFLWTAAGGMIDLGTLGGDFVSSEATAINNAGQVVGVSSTAAGATAHAFLWTAAGGMVDLGALGSGSQGAVTDINDAGQVVGWGSPQAFPQAFLWTAAEGMVLLPGPSNAIGINNLGQVVGGVSGIGAAMWTATGGWVGIAGTSSWASDINNAGRPSVTFSCQTARTAPRSGVRRGRIWRWTSVPHRASGRSRASTSGNRCTP